MEFFVCKQKKSFHIFLPNDRGVRAYNVHHIRDHGRDDDGDVPLFLALLIILPKHPYPEFSQNRINWCSKFQLIQREKNLQELV